MKINGEKIIRFCGHSSDPSVYSGRGATLADLNSNLLEKIYALLQIEAGPEVAEKFVQFVYDLEKLSMTSFLNRFYEFCRQGGNYVCRPHDILEEHDVGPDGEYRFGIVMSSILAVATGQNLRDDTEEIRRDFLVKHENEFTRNKQQDKKRRLHAIV